MKYKFYIPLQPELRYGVMVALQILVLSVKVRILVSQPRMKVVITDGLFLFLVNKDIEIFLIL